MSLSYVLTSAAEDDLRAIIRYTRRQWGAAQARTYVAKLDRGITLMATGGRQALDVGSLHPGLRTGRVEHHHIFWLPREAQPTLVVALLHERMDLMTRLAGRLG